MDQNGSLDPRQGGIAAILVQVLVPLCFRLLIVDV